IPPRRPTTNRPTSVPQLSKSSAKTIPLVHPTHLWKETFRLGIPSALSLLPASAFPSISNGLCEIRSKEFYATLKDFVLNREGFEDVKNGPRNWEDSIRRLFEFEGGGVWELVNVAMRNGWWDVMEEEVGGYLSGEWECEEGKRGVEEEGEGCVRILPRFSAVAQVKEHDGGRRIARDAETEATDAHETVVRKRLYIFATYLLLASHTSTLLPLFTSSSPPLSSASKLHALLSPHLPLTPTHFPPLLTSLGLPPLLSLASRTGNPNLVQHLLQLPSCPPATPTCLSLAASRNHLPLLHLFHTHPKTTHLFTPQTMDDASANGHLLVLQFLHRHRTEGCTEWALTLAAVNGHVEVVRFLHENRQEGGLPHAMDHAAERGFLEVVRFLHEEREEGCTTFAMDAAARNGFLEVVRFLHEEREEGCTTDAADMAAAAGHVEVLEFLLKEREEGWTWRGLQAARERGLEDVVEVLMRWECKRREVGGGPSWV
ncbi:hypothetical protein HDV05_005830, partial [Chytridiales sp. JEL 0842]